MENCPGVELVLVALKCDLRPSNSGDDADDDTAPARKEMLTYKAGLDVAKRIRALRYLECSAMKNRGVNEAFTEAARVALKVEPKRAGGGGGARSGINSVKNKLSATKCSVM